MTLSPPKSISIQALVAGDRRLIERTAKPRSAPSKRSSRAHLTRQHGGKEWVQTGNVVAVMFEHHEARESINGQHGPMPQLHHHTFIANLTRRGDGQWRGLDPDQIYKVEKLHRRGVHGGAREKRPGARLSDRAPCRRPLRIGWLYQKADRGVQRTRARHRGQKSRTQH